MTRSSSSYYNVLKKVECLRDVIAEKFFANTHGELNSEEVGDRYKAVFYAFLLAAAKRKKLQDKLKDRIRNRIGVRLLWSAAIDELSGWGSRSCSISSLLESLDEYINRPAVNGEDYLDRAIKDLKESIRKVDSVIVYDAMSVIEELVISAYLKAKRGLDSSFLTMLMNLPGLTRGVTSQLQATDHPATLREVAKRVARDLGANDKEPKYYNIVDRVVHEKGPVIELFVNDIAANIKGIAEDIAKVAKSGQSRVVILSDHGYDVIACPDGDVDVYVTHGFREGAASGCPSGRSALPLLLLSRFAFYMGVLGRV